MVLFGGRSLTKIFMSEFVRLPYESHPLVAALGGSLCAGNRDYPKQPLAAGLLCDFFLRNRLRLQFGGVLPGSVFARYLAAIVEAFANFQESFIAQLRKVS